MATGARKSARAAGKRDAPAGNDAHSITPMLAMIGDGIPRAGDWTFEPKYDGIRVLAFLAGKRVTLITRNGKKKTDQFPEIVEGLKELSRKARRELVLDGEIVALASGEPARFQDLQRRMHVREAGAITRHSTDTPSALVLFDILVDGKKTLLTEPWTTRRKHLERVLKYGPADSVRLAESGRDGEAMLARAEAGGWEGVIAKRTDATYRPGTRSRDWRKLKLEFRQEFVVGGFTEPRNTREHIGALLLGYFDHGRLIYAGHTGGGFTRAGLRAMYERLARLERTTSPFTETPKTNERAHWVRPEVVVEVKFNEWTVDGKLRQPIYLGIRDDKEPRAVGREPDSVQRPGAPGDVEAMPDEPVSSGGPEKNAAKVASQVASKRTGKHAAKKPGRSTRVARPEAGDEQEARAIPATQLKRASTLASRLEKLEEEGGGRLVLARGSSLELTNLGKVYYPDAGLTKGDLLRYYVRVASVLLPAIEGRPLVLQRFPNGIRGKSFYQQKAPDSVPAGVRVETIENEKGERQRRLIGGDLATLLYAVQLGAISVDPWHGRVDALEFADYAIIDLDPGPRAPFQRVVEVALLVRDQLDSLGMHGIAKTSGASGIHVAVPLPPHTTEETARILAELIATRIAEANPRIATTARSVKARPPAAVYVDYLQNIRSKTVAAVYSARAREGATVSTPLRWAELEGELSPAQFTIETLPGRLAEVGDLWGPAMKRRNEMPA